eukprot:5916252-Prymnesium_polylepis.1
MTMRGLRTSSTCHSGIRSLKGSPANLAARLARREGRATVTTTERDTAGNVRPRSSIQQEEGKEAAAGAIPRVLAVVESSV